MKRRRLDSADVDNDGDYDDDSDYGIDKKKGGRYEMKA